VAVVTSGSDADSTTSQSDSGLEDIGSRLTMLRGCDNDQILKWDETNDEWDCSTDSGGSAGTGGTVEVKSNNVFQASAQTIDFSTEFGVSMTGTSEANITLTNSFGTLNTGDLCTNDGTDVACTVNFESGLETAMDSLDILTVTGDDINSANFATLLSDETGTGQVMFNNTPTASSMTINTALTIGAYALPVVDGSADEVLTTDGAGTVSWNAQSGSGSGTSGTVEVKENDVFFASAQTIDFSSYFTVTMTGTSEANVNLTSPIPDDGTDDTVMVSDGALWQWRSMPDCDEGSGHLNYDTSGNAFDCGTTDYFGSIDVNSEGTITPDQIDDALTLTEGDNIHLVVGTGTDTITINSTGSSGTGGTVNAKASNVFLASAEAIDWDTDFDITIVSASEANVTLAADFSSEVASKIQDETGTGQMMFNNAPTASDLTVDTSLTIPSGGPTIDEAGEIGVDTTDDQFAYFGTAKRILASLQTISIALEQPEDADSFIFRRFTDAVTITGVECIVDPAGTSESSVIDVQECDSNGDNCATILNSAITCQNTTTSGTLSDGGIDAGDWALLDIGAETGDASWVTVNIGYTFDAQ